MHFNELNLIPALLRAIGDVGYDKPTPIQAQAIPPVLEGRDALGCAQTGTGKTAAFAIPTLQRLMLVPPQKGRRPIRALIVTPTRELALQIHENFSDYGAYLPLRCCVMFGGVSQKPQEEQLARGYDILVATPGRLNDLIGQGLVDLSSVEIFILDEADRMLDMGFIHDVKKIIRHLPAKKQTLLFSATMPQEITALANSLLHDPVRIEVTPGVPTVERIRQTLYYVDKDNKCSLLLALLRKNEVESMLVFTRTKHGADRLCKQLVRDGISAAAIHGDKSQTARQRALSGFKAREVKVLVATDIAARGIDIDELSHVVNYELPEVPETYVHRIGRTGRAGLGGEAISFCMFDEKPLLSDIEKLIGKRLAVVENHPYPLKNNFPTVKQTQQRPPRPARQESQRPDVSRPRERKKGPPVRVETVTHRAVNAPRARRDGNAT